MTFLENLSKKIWRGLALRKLKSKKLHTQVKAIQIIGEYGYPEDYEILLPFLDSDENIIRLTATIAIRNLFIKDPQIAKNRLIEEFQNAYLLKKITIIEILQELPLEEREKLFGKMIQEASDDLLYAIIQTLKGTTDIDLLDNILEATHTKDQVLRKVAYQAWFAGIENMDHETKVNYGTPRLHQLIRATYETKDEGNTLYFVLSHANKELFPEPKAYPEFIIRYLIELINTWEYDPDANRSIHRLVVPAYFTFKEEKDMKERPFIQI